jgi:hypothetical protein
MDFWLLDVKSTEEVDGKQVAFDYINTYYDKDKAISDAKELSKKENILDVGVHHWILKADGTQEHVESNDSRDELPYYFLNRNHWELKEAAR